MKTHDIARALDQLAVLLRSGSNVDLKDVRISTKEQAELSMQGVAVNLSTLVSLSRLSKSEWVRFIEHYKLPVDVKKTESVRDLLGRLLVYLERNEDARERLKRESTGTGRASPELLKALQVLLREAP